MRALVNGKIITPLEEIDKGTILIKGRKIQGVGQDIAIPPDTQIIEAEGKIVCPGFIDLHLHGARGHDFAEGTPEAVREIISFHLTHGTTSFLPTLISLSDEQIHKVIEQLPWSWLEAGSASFLGIHLEGPFLNPAYRGVHNNRYLCAPCLKKLEAFFSHYAKIIKMITLAPELPQAMEVIPWLSKREDERKVVVSLGHSAATYLQVEQAVRQGLSHVTHIFNAMSGLHHREPGAVGATLDIEGLSTDIIVDGWHVHPAAVRLLWRQKGVDKVILITDASPVCGLPSGTYPLWEREVRLDKDKVVTTDSEKLAGSAITMNKSIQNFQAFTGCNYKEAIRTATYNPAVLLGIENQKGLLVEGNDADVLIMDENFRIETVIIGGEIRHKL